MTNEQRDNIIDIGLKYYIKTLERKMNSEFNPAIKLLILKDINEAKEYQTELQQPKKKPA